MDGSKESPEKKKTRLYAEAVAVIGEDEIAKLGEQARVELKTLLKVYIGAAIDNEVKAESERDNAAKERDRAVMAEKDKNTEHEKYVQAYSLVCVRLYLGQLEREFSEGSKTPSKDQMIKDLEHAGKAIQFTGVSIHYIHWMWFLKISNYGPARDLHRLVKKHFAEFDDFVALLSHLWGEASGQIHHPVGTLSAEEIKRGLGFYGLASKRMDLAIDILFQLKKISPRRKRPSSSKVSEHEQNKRVIVNRSTFMSETDSS